MNPKCKYCGLTKEEHIDPAAFIPDIEPIAESDPTDGDILQWQQDNAGKFNIGKDLGDNPQYSIVMRYQTFVGPTLRLAITAAMQSK